MFNVKPSFLVVLSFQRLVQAVRSIRIRAADLVLRAERDGEGAEDALAHADEEGALLAYVREHVLRLLPLDARVEPRLPLVLVGRRDGAPEGDGELGRDERSLLVVRDERVQRVEEDLRLIVADSTTCIPGEG